MGRTAMGVIGMQLNDGDEVIGMQLNTQGDHLLIVSANGMGKLTSIDEFKSQNRGGKGVKCYKIMEKTGNVIGVKNLHMDDEIMMINTEGIVIRMMCSDISVLGRVTSGVKLMNLSENVSVASIAKVRETSADSEDIIKKIEDEMIQHIRLNALMAAMWINYLLLIVVSLSIYNIDYLTVMACGMATPLVIFLLVYHFNLYKLNRNLHHEE